MRWLRFPDFPWLMPSAFIRRAVAMRSTRSLRSDTWFIRPSVISTLLDPCLVPAVEFLEILQRFSECLLSTSNLALNGLDLRGIAGEMLLIQQQIETLVLCRNQFFRRTVYGSFSLVDLFAPIRNHGRSPNSSDSSASSRGMAVS